MNKAFENHVAMPYTDASKQRTEIRQRIYRNMRPLRPHEFNEESTRKTYFQIGNQEIEKINILLRHLDEAIKKQENEIPITTIYISGEINGFMALLEGCSHEMNQQQKSSFEKLKKREKNLPELEKKAKEKLFGY